MSENTDVILRPQTVAQRPARQQMVVRATAQEEGVQSRRQVLRHPSQSYYPLELFSISPSTFEEGI